MLDNNKCILVYGLTKDEIQWLNDLNYKVINISPDMCEMTVKEVLEGLRFEIINNNPIKEKAITRTKIKGGVLAMVTPNSINWTFNYLINHLIEEREWHLRNRKE